MISTNFITIVVRKQTTEYTEFVLNIHTLQAAERAKVLIKNLPPNLRKYAITEISEEIARNEPLSLLEDDMFGSTLR